jgi:hypothetical protein
LVGPEYYLLALLAEPSVATEALAALGVTYDRLHGHLRNQEEEPQWAPPRYEQAKGLSPNPAAYKLEARAEGLALAWGHAACRRRAGRTGGHRPGADHRAAVCAVSAGGTAG